jgi:hypothetical protein
MTRWAWSPPSRPGTFRSISWRARPPPRLAAGCAIIAKGPEETPGSCAEFVRCLQDAGLPDGRAQPRVRRAGGHLRAPHTPPCRAQGVLHRLHACRQASGGHGGPAHEARHHGTGRPRAGAGVRRRGHRSRRRGRRGAPSSATPARPASVPTRFLVQQRGSRALRPRFRGRDSARSRSATAWIRPAGWVPWPIRAVCRPWSG